MLSLNIKWGNVTEEFIEDGNAWVTPLLLNTSIKGDKTA